MPLDLKTHLKITSALSASGWGSSAVILQACHYVTAKKEAGLPSIHPCDTWYSGLLVNPAVL